MLSGHVPSVVHTASCNEKKGTTCDYSFLKEKRTIELSWIEKVVNKKVVDEFFSLFLATLQQQCSVLLWQTERRRNTTALDQCSTNWNESRALLLVLLFDSTVFFSVLFRVLRLSLAHIVSRCFLSFQFFIPSASSIPCIGVHRLG